MYDGLCSALFLFRCETRHRKTAKAHPVTHSPTRPLCSNPPKATDGDDFVVAARFDATSILRCRMPGLAAGRYHVELVVQEAELVSPEFIPVSWCGEACDGLNHEGIVNQSLMNGWGRASMEDGL